MKLRRLMFLGLLLLAGCSSATSALQRYTFTVSIESIDLSKPQPGEFTHTVVLARGMDGRVLQRVSPDANGTATFDFRSAEPPMQIEAVGYVNTDLYSGSVISFTPAKPDAHQQFCIILPPGCI